MRSLVLTLLAGTFLVLAAKNAYKADMFQIQGVQVVDEESDSDVSRHSAHARKRRQAEEPVLPAYASAAIQQRTLRHYASLLQQLQQQQQLLQTNPAQYLQPPPANRQLLQQQVAVDTPLQRLPAAGINHLNSLQQQQAQVSALLQQQQQLPLIPQPPRPSPPQITPNRTAVRRPSSKGHEYYYPPRMPLPLPKCFHNPTGYVCCNEQLNDLMVDTYTALEQKPKFHACNIQLIASHLQMNAERHFNTTFETLVAYEDFAQKIHFRGDMVCKVELGSRYMLAYATASDDYDHAKRSKRSTDEFEWSSGMDNSWTSVHSSFI